MPEQVAATVTILVHHNPRSRLCWCATCIPPEGCTNVVQMEAKGESLSEVLEELGEMVAEWEDDMLFDLYESGDDVDDD